MQKSANGKPMPYPGRKLLITMKLTAILLCVSLLKVSAEDVKAQTLTLNFKSTPLQKVFDEIERQSGYSFLYGKRMLQSAAPVSLDLRNASLEQALDAVFAQEPLGYKIADKQIIVSQKTAPQPQPQISITNEPPPQVTGRILNENGDWFWVQWSEWRTIRHFLLYRLGLSGARAVPTLARLAVFPFTLLYLILYAAAAHARRALRS